MSLAEQLRIRLKRLHVKPEDIGFGADLDFLEDSEGRGRPDRYLYDDLNERLSEIEHDHLSCPFLDPDISSGIDQGNVVIGQTLNGIIVRISF